METKCNLCCLLLVLLISTITCTVSEGQKQPTEDEYPEYTPENMKDIIVRELKPLQKIIFEFQNTMTTKMETITVLEYNLSHKMKEITDNIFIEQTTNITKHIGGKINSAFKTNDLILSSTENINNRLVRIENDLQDSIVTKLDEITGIDNAISRGIKDITYNTLLDQTRNITKKISDKISSTLKEHNVESTEQINRRLSAIETLQNSIISRLQIQEASNNRKEKELSDKIYILSSNTKQIMEKTDSLHKEQSTLELLENMITSKLAAMKDDLQMNMFKKWEILENNVNVLTTNINQQKEKHCVYNAQTVPVALEQDNSRLVALENIAKLEEHNMQNLINISEQIQASVNKLNQQYDYLKNETTTTKICNLNPEARESIENIVLEQTKNITQQVTNKQKEILTSIDNIKTKVELLQNTLNKRKETTAQATNQTTAALKNSSTHLQQCGTGTENYKKFSWCHAVPSTVNIRKDIWSGQAPAEDDLDRFLVSKTGCTYKAVRFYDGFYLPDASYDGTLYEWRVSVRAGDGVWMGVEWDGRYRYGFNIGYSSQSHSWVYYWATHTTHTLPERDYVSTARYVRYYVRLQPGSVTFGRECDSAPLYTGTHPTVARGTALKMRLYSASAFGAKYLYNCCPAVTGNIAHNTA